MGAPASSTTLDHVGRSEDQQNGLRPHLKRYGSDSYTAISLRFGSCRLVVEPAMARNPREAQVWAIDSRTELEVATLRPLGLNDGFVRVKSFAQLMSLTRN